MGVCFWGKISLALCQNHLPRPPKGVGWRESKRTRPLRAGSGWSSKGGGAKNGAEQGGGAWRDKMSVCGNHRGGCTRWFVEVVVVVRGGSSRWLWLYEVVRGCSWFEEVRSSCRARSSFVAVRVLASELALSAAGPCVPRRHVPPGHEAANGTQGSPLFFCFPFGFLCVCVCVCREASSAK